MADQNLPSNMPPVPQGSVATNPLNQTPNVPPPPHQREEGPKIKVEVRSRGEKGFRRLGQFFGTDPVEIECTENEYETRLKNEGQLIVRRMDGKDKAGAQAPAGGSTPPPANTATQLGGNPLGTGGHTPGGGTLAEGKPLDSENQAKGRGGK